MNVFLGCKLWSRSFPWPSSLLFHGLLLIFFPEYKNLLGRPPARKVHNLRNVTQLSRIAESVLSTEGVKTTLTQVRGCNTIIVVV